MNIYINNNRKTKYVSLADRISSEIEEGKLSGRLPTMEVLADRHKVAIATMQKAVDVLKQRRLVQAFAGQGIFTNMVKGRAKTNKIALLISGGPQYKFDEMPLSFALIGGAKRQALTERYDVYTEESAWNPQKQFEKVREIVESGSADGIIIWLQQEEGRSEIVDYLKEFMFPFIIVPHPDIRIYEDCHTVSNMESNAPTDLMLLLLGQGYRDIAYVTNTYYGSHEYNHKRYAQYVHAMETAGLEVSKPIIIDCEGNDPATVKNTISRAISRHEALFCVTDVIAARVLSVCLEKGVKVPEDLAVAGYDNLKLAEYFNLTSVEQHFAEIGARAVEILLDDIDGNLPRPTHAVINSELVIRGSTKRVK